MAEERDATNTVQKRFFAQGEQIGSQSYYYTYDHLGSVTEMTDSSGNIQARYDYDPYGRTTLVQGTNLSDFQYAGYYAHQPSEINLRGTAPMILIRPRDPLPDAEMSQGPNLYDYVLNNPIMGIDPLGLDVYFNSQLNSDRQHFWINIGPDSNGNSTYGRYPAGGNLSDLWSSQSIITSPDALHSGDTTGYNSIDYSTTSAEEAELKKWIQDNYDLNKASTKNGSYHLGTHDCQQFAAAVANRDRWRYCLCGDFQRQSWIIFANGPTRENFGSNGGKGRLLPRRAWKRQVSF